MLRSISWEQFLEWEHFSTVEPFGEERDDIRFASVVQALWNIARDTKACPNGWPLEDFILSFGDAPRRKEEKQSIETQELLIDNWIGGHNAALAAKEARA